MIHDCEAESLGLQFYYSVPVLGKQQAYAAAFLSQEGFIVGLLASSRAGQHRGARPLACCRSSATAVC